SRCSATIDTSALPLHDALPIFEEPVEPAAEGEPAAPQLHVRAEHGRQEDLGGRGHPAERADHVRNEAVLRPPERIPDAQVHDRERILAIDLRIGNVDTRGIPSEEDREPVGEAPPHDETAATPLLPVAVLDLQ